jgi:hypothetical protein
MYYVLVFSIYGSEPVCIMALYGSVFTSSRFKGQSSVKQAKGPALRVLKESTDITSRDRLMVRTLRCGRRFESWSRHDSFPVMKLKWKMKIRTFSVDKSNLISLTSRIQG